MGERCEALRQVLDSLAEYQISPSRLKFSDSGIIGSGGYSTVRRAVLFPPGVTPNAHSDIGMAVTVKALLPKEHEPLRLAMRLAREVRARVALDHPNILRFCGFHLDEGKQAYWLVSPFLSNGSLRHYLDGHQDLPMHQLITWVQNMTEGLVYLHMQNPPIVFGELKAANILLNDSLDAVLCDFGFTFAEGITTGLDTSDGFKGSLRWSSPELFNDNPRSLASDIWSWACTLLEIMTGQHPYATIHSDFSVILKILHGAVQQDDWPGFPLDWFIWPHLSRCFQLDPFSRPSSLGCRDAVVDLEIKFVSETTTYDNTTFSATSTGTWSQRTSETLRPPEPYEPESARRTLEDITKSLSRFSIRPSKLTLETFPFNAGGCGSVYIASLTTGDAPQSVTVAVKRLHNKCQDTTRIAIRLMREIAIWQRLDHPNVLPFVGFHLDLDSPDGANTYVVASYLQHGSISKYLTCHSVEDGQRLTWVQGVTNGLHYLHHACTPPIIHGDMKADNILINESLEPVLCDFGLAVSPGDVWHASLQTTNSLKYSLRWCSPEILNEIGVQSVGSDIWAWACVVLEILTNRLPFYNLRKEIDVMQRIKEGDGPRLEEYPPFLLQEPIWSLLAKCFQMDPALRPDSTDCLATAQDWRL